MKRIILLFSCLCLIIGSSSVFFSQEQETVTPQIKRDLAPTYNSAGRRDPFRDLLGGRDVESPSFAEGIPQIYIDDVVLVGIVKSQGTYTAIINGGQGFPYYIKDGEEFADGYVQTIEESRVIFSKTHERGIKLLKPKEVIKEIYPQEQ